MQRTRNRYVQERTDIERSSKGRIPHKRTRYGSVSNKTDEQDKRQ